MSLVRVLTFSLVSVVVLAAVISGAEKKQWPDVTCHPIYKKDTRRAGRVNTNAQRWADCQQYERKDGICPQVCFLKWSLLLITEGGQEVKVSVSGLVHWIAKTNGYLEGLGGKEAEQLLKKVEKNMEGCRDKHTEIKTMQMNETCTPWEPFLKCIDEGYMCVKN